MDRTGASLGIQRNTFLITFLLSAFLLRFDGAYFIILFACSASLLWCATLVKEKISRASARPEACAILIILGACLAFLAVARIDSESHRDAFGSWENQNVTIDGIITSGPERGREATKYVVRIKTVTSDQRPVTGPEQSKADRWLLATGHSLLLTDMATWPEFRIGDRISASGKLRLPKDSYAEYLSTRDIGALLTSYRPALMERGEASWVQPLWTFKENIRTRIERTYVEPGSSLLVGLLLGDRGRIDERVIDDFRRAGLTHILAVSGYNITLVLAFLGSMLFFLPFRWRFIPLAIGVITFVILVGASASAVRAAIMGILGLLGAALGRGNDVRFFTLLAASMMTAWNPLLLWYDPGFQLSFAAVIGITELSPFLHEWLKKVPDTLGLRTELVTTLAAQIATMPISIWQFQQISFISPVANILVAPLIPLAMLGGVLGILTGTISDTLGLAVSFVGHMFLESMMVIAHVCASVPFATIEW